MPIKDPELLQLLSEAQKGRVRVIIWYSQDLYLFSTTRTSAKSIRKRWSVCSWNCGIIRYVHGPCLCQEHSQAFLARVSKRDAPDYYDGMLFIRAYGCTQWLFPLPLTSLIHAFHSSHKKSHGSRYHAEEASQRAV